VADFALGARLRLRCYRGFQMKSVWWSRSVKIHRTKIPVDPGHTKDIVNPAFYMSDL